MLCLPFLTTSDIQASSNGVPKDVQDLVSKSRDFLASSLYYPSHNRSHRMRLTRRAQIMDNKSPATNALFKRHHHHICDKSRERTEPDRARCRHEGELVRWDEFMPLRALKVLLVENDDATRHLVSSLLRNCGYQVNAVENGEQAWKVVEDLSTDIDLVLTEVVMPKLSGIGLLGKMMRKKIYQNIPVIMMSSYDSKSMVFKCLSKGAVDFLVKPLRKNELKNIYQHVWRIHHIRNDAIGSESGFWNESSMRWRIIEDSDNTCGSNDEDDSESIIGLNFKNESESTSPEQFLPSSSAVADHPWKESFSVPHKETRIIGDDDDLDKKLMGKDLRIGIYSSPSLQLQDITRGDDKDKSSEMRSKDERIHMNKVDLDLNNEQPNREINTQAIDLFGFSTITMDLHTEKSASYHNTSMNYKAIHEPLEIPFFEVQPNGVRDIATSAWDRNLWRHSDLSAFSSAQFDSNEIPGSSNAMSSTTNDASAKKVSFAEMKMAMLQTSCAFGKIHDAQISLQTVIQGASESGLSNIIRATMHGSVTNRSLNKFTSGSNINGTNGQKRGKSASNSRRKKADIKTEKRRSENRSKEDANCFAHKEAALKRFRQKRQERCFDKKVRYQSRKALAEQRPRVRGQFIGKGLHENNGKGISYEPDTNPK